MKNIQHIILIALFAIVMVSCNKDAELNTSAFNTPETASIIKHNHTTTSKRKCASKAHTELKMQDPAYRAEREKSMEAFERNLRRSSSRSRAACSSPTILPVAVHYQGISSPDKACLIQTAKEAVAVLNADFQGKNSDIAQWKNTASAYYPGISNGEACVGFQLATTNHPAGFGLANGDVAVTINKTNGDQANEWSGYINIFVGDADGSLGYAPLGGSGNGDGMMITSGAFAIGSGCAGVSSQSPNDLGRTLTHEMGHYLNLDHIWGDGGCSADDQVADTPMQASENYGCPTLGSTPACSGEALHMNFMDYADDACMYMFTAGQASRVESWINSGLLNNLKKAADVFGGASTPDTSTGTDNTGDVAGTDTNTDTTGDNNTDNSDNTDNSTDNTDNTEEEDTDDYDYEEEGDYDYEEEGGQDGDAAAVSTITLKVTLDDFGSETTFAIFDDNGDAIGEYGPFEDGQAGQVITKEIGLSTGLYTFVIFDDFGDGICCDEGNGRWNLYQDGTQIKSSNGKFGYWEEYDFAVGNARLAAPAHRIDPQVEGRSKGQKGRKLVIEN